EGKLVDGTWIKDLSTKKEVLLKKRISGEETREGALSPSQNWLVFDRAVNVGKKDEYEELRILGTNSGNERTVLRNKNGFIFDWHPTNDFLAVLPIGLTEHFILDPRTLEFWRIDLPLEQNELTNFGHFFWLRDGKTILIVSGPTSDKTKIGLYQ